MKLQVKAKITNYVDVTTIKWGTQYPILKKDIYIQYPFFRPLISTIEVVPFSGNVREIGYSTLPKVKSPKHADFPEKEVTILVEIIHEEIFEIEKDWSGKDNEPAFIYDRLVEYFSHTNDYSHIELVKVKALKD